MTQGVMTQSRKQAVDQTFLRLTCGDFKHNPDGSWVTTRQINIVGNGGEQMLILAGRRFTKGQMFILGLDLAAILERQCG